MVEMLVELELNMQAIFNPHLHLHLSHCLSLFSVVIVVHNCEVNFLGHCGLHVSVDKGSNEIPDPSCNPIEGLILFLEVGKFEVELFFLSQDACGLKLFG